MRAFMNEHLHVFFYLFQYYSFIKAPCLKTVETEFTVVPVPGGKSLFKVIQTRYVCLQISLVQVLQRYHPSITNKN